MYLLLARRYRELPKQLIEPDCRAHIRRSPGVQAHLHDRGEEHPTPKLRRRWK